MTVKNMVFGLKSSKSTISGFVLATKSNLPGKRAFQVGSASQWYLSITAQQGETIGNTLKSTKKTNKQKNTNIGLQHRLMVCSPLRLNHVIIQDLFC